MPSNLPITVSDTNQTHCESTTTKDDRTPRDTLNSYAEQWGLEFTNEAFARKLDQIDPLQHLRNEFYIPKLRTLPKGISLRNF